MRFMGIGSRNDPILWSSVHLHAFYVGSCIFGNRSSHLKCFSFEHDRGAHVTVKKKKEKERELPCVAAGCE